MVPENVPATLGMCSIVGCVLQGFQTGSLLKKKKKKHKSNHLDH